MKKVLHIYICSKKQEWGLEIREAARVCNQLDGRVVRVASRCSGRTQSAFLNGARLAMLREKQSFLHGKEL